jgi:hypothetical protein
MCFGRLADLDLCQTTTIRNVHITLISQGGARETSESVKSPNKQKTETFKEFATGLLILHDFVRYCHTEKSLRNVYNETLDLVRDPGNVFFQRNNFKEVENPHVLSLARRRTIRCVRSKLHAIGTRTRETSELIKSPNMQKTQKYQRLRKYQTAKRLTNMYDEVLHPGKYSTCSTRSQ